ncbi:MAG: hypothetical protein P4L46_20340 [Fimbriimonas sp.]|nr:hypothetical protein [Fimbriimonas sp.]
MPEDTMTDSRLVIRRDADNDIKMRGLEVFLDDEFVKDLSFGSEQSLDVSPGNHTLKVTNHLYTRRLEVEAKPGETLDIQVGNYFDGLGGIMMAVFGFGHYKVFMKVQPRATSNESLLHA